MRMFFIIFLSIFYTSLGAFADVGTLNSYTYRVYFPKNIDCARELASVATRFTQQTGIAISSQNCVTIDSSNFSDPTFKVNAGVLVYLAAQELIGNPVLLGEPEANGVSLGLPMDYAGIYKSYAACLSDIPLQTEVFSNVTKTEPVAVYCMPAKAITDTYVLHVDSFQAEKMRFFVFQAFQGIPTNEALTTALQMVSSGGTTIAKVYGNLIYFYDTSATDFDWSPEHVHLKNIIAGIFESAAQCANQLQVVTSALLQGRISSLLVTCTSDKNYGSPLLEITGDLTHIGLGSSGRDYFSMEECLQDKERALADYSKSSAPVEVIGGFCSFANLNNYRLHTIETF